MTTEYTHTRIKTKKQIGYAFIVFGLLKAGFIFYERFSGHNIPFVEDASYAILALMGLALIFTDIQNYLKDYTLWIYQKIELGLIDALNYTLVKIVVSFTNMFRKTHTGVLRHNLVAIQAGGIILLLAFLILGGYL